MTAKMTAAGRALESRRPDRLFDDPLAAVLAGDEGVRWMEEMRLPTTPVENPTIGPRTRYLDDLVVGAASTGVRQAVLVAAGMDTRAFRLNLPKEMVVFELDEPALLEEKQIILGHEEATPICRRVVIPVDLRTDGWTLALRAVGFDISEPAVFLAEGLSYYLDEDENARLLDHLARLGATGSRLGIDMASRDYLDNPVLAPFFDLAAARGVQWKFGTNDPEEFLAAHGWRAHVETFDVVGRRYGRWPPPGVSEEIAARAATLSRSFVITADRMLSYGWEEPGSSGLDLRLT